MEQNGQKGYYVFNGHGDVVQMRNASGEQVYGKLYDAFGVEMENGTSTNPFTNPFGYAGEYTDKETVTSTSVPDTITQAQAAS